MPVKSLELLSSNLSFCSATMMHFVKNFSVVPMFCAMHTSSSKALINIVYFSFASVEKLQLSNHLNVVTIFCHFI
jgi:hypothetical protein